MNSLQRYNQLLLRKSLFSPQILSSIFIQQDGILSIENKNWEEYWGKEQVSSPLLSALFLSWQRWIRDQFDPVFLNQYVHDYFKLLEDSLTCYYAGKIFVSELSKIISFEIFMIHSSEIESSVCSIFSSRNPVYLLHKIANPTAPDDPKYLPVICPLTKEDCLPRLYFHYRRIPIKNSLGTQLFVYPAVQSTPSISRPNKSKSIESQRVGLNDHKSIPEDTPQQSSHLTNEFSTIDRLFRILTPKNDPWVQLRLKSLYQCIFKDLISNIDSSSIRLIDLGCGSAKMSMRLCQQAHLDSSKNFDLTLVDGIQSRFSIAKTFYKSNQAFQTVRYCRYDIFQWIRNRQNSTNFSDITLMLRVFNTLSRFQVKSVSIQELCPQMLRDKHFAENQKVSSQILNNPDQIIHRLQKIKFTNGYSYWQLALNHYFKAIYCCMNPCDIDQKSEVYLPVRSFSENSLIFEDGSSVIERIMNNSSHLVIEDVDFSFHYLRQHVRRFQLDHLDIFDRSPRKNDGGTNYLLVSHKANR